MTTGSVLAQFTITLSQAASEPVLVEWYTSDGTAKAGVDYAANKGVATFSPGETSKAVSILVYGRAVGSEDRSFFVEMLPPVNAILGASIGECIIHVDTTGSTPVTVIVVPTGPRGLEGKSAYQVWLDLGNTGTEQDFIDSLSPSAADIAEEVAPLLNLGNSQVTAEGTESLGKPDTIPLKTLARRIAYVGAAKIAIVTLADGDNLIAHDDLAGDAIDFSSVGLYPRIMRGASVISPIWSLESDGRLLIKSAVAGDILYALQYDLVSKHAIEQVSQPIAEQSTEGLRQAIASDYGSGMVGGALYADIRAYDGGAGRLYCLGRSNMFDGAHGWFKRIATSKADNDGVYLVDALGRTWEREITAEVNPVWFGALPLGGGDSLPALNAATAFARTRGGLVPPIIRVPGGNYTINGMWDIFDLAQATIILDGPYFSGVSSAAQDAVVRINNASNLKIVGSATVSANYLANYASAFAVIASPGGLIEPDKGIVSHVDIFGITAKEAKIGFKNGKKDLDAQIAELQYHGCETVACPVAAYNGGSQTGATYVGCTIASAPGTFALTSKFRVFDMDGGFVQMVGGELINSGVPVGTADHVAIEFKPAQSTTYGNPFGSIKLSGVHIELTSALFIVGNGGIADPLKSVDSNISLSNCGGFIEQPTIVGSPTTTASDFATVYEPSFAGKIAIDVTCNFYTTQTRTGLNINSSAAPGAKIEVGRTAFGAGFRDWMGGCLGGILHHPLLPVVMATGTSQSFPASTQTVIKLASISGLSGMGRYGVYSPSTGEITIPKGCRNMTIKFSAQGNGFAGDIFVRKGASGIAQFGAVGSGGVVALDFNESAPTEGDKYTLVMQPSSGPITLNGAKMTVCMEF